MYVYTYVNKIRTVYIFMDYSFIIPSTLNIGFDRLEDLLSHCYVKLHSE